MSTIHYSKCLLNTYAATPYFRANAPPNYPLTRVLAKSRAFRRLPPNLRELSEKAKEWAAHAYAPRSPERATGVEGWYDGEGYELDPDSGRRLTDAQIDADWDRYQDDELDRFEVEDIPVPDGGFPDPETWEEPDPEPDTDEEPDGITEDQIIRDIRSHGREYAAKYYGIPTDQLAKFDTNEQLAAAIHKKITGHGEENTDE